MDIVRELAATADDLWRQLIDTHKSCKVVNDHAINLIWTNKLEVDAHLGMACICCLGTRVCCKRF